MEKYLSGAITLVQEQPQMTGKTKGDGVTKAGSTPVGDAPQPVPRSV